MGCDAKEPKPAERVRHARAQSRDGKRRGPLGHRHVLKQVRGQEIFERDGRQRSNRYEHEQEDARCKSDGTNCAWRMSAGRNDICGA
jgi:hypothetical protein